MIYEGAATVLCWYLTSRSSVDGSTVWFEMNQLEISTATCSWIRQQVRHLWWKTKALLLLCCRKFREKSWQWNVCFCLFVFMLWEKQAKWKLIRCNQSHAQDKANGAGCGGGGCTFTEPYANFIHSHGRSLSKNTVSHVVLSSGRSFRVTIYWAVVCQSSRKEII